ncbi:MAG TPA: DUF1631 family protein [Ottowia sp.]|uniref:DUF1631 family protein n=1 Tax=Ottowia sp. TaxID=1898956 RepID=UPI002B7F4167|nr:DUF1631 family protein [Ottowia sp.]HMN21799.1 DUF1631 family protein [Ottowia sp.]
MVTNPQPGAMAAAQLAREVRERFARAVTGLVDALPAAVEAQLDGVLRDSKGLTMAQLSVAMEAAGAFKRLRGAWVEAVHAQWRAALAPRVHEAQPQKPLAKFGLVDDDVVEDKILASRLGAAVLEVAGSEWSDLRMRMQRLERNGELAADDPLRPDVFALALVKGWADCGLKRPMWNLVQAGLQPVLARHYQEAYAQGNVLLRQHGVEAELALRARVQRSGGPPTGVRDETRASGVRSGQAPFDSTGGWSGRDARASRSGHGSVAPSGPVDARAAWSASPAAQRHQAGAVAADVPAGTTEWRDGVAQSALARAAQETRMVTGMSPVARVRQRAQGVLGQLRRLLSDPAVGYDSGAAPQAPSPQLARALAEPPDAAYAVTELMHRVDGDTVPHLMPDVGAVARQLRQRAADLKAKAEKPSEKAVIEIVALMFQAILAEERIAAGVRVWFARLQIPVLRLALAEPDFFASADHPARQLIDRMGACALGFDAAQVAGDRLEREVKRIVQVIEQYPETGRRVYQLVLEEFKKFLGSSLTEGKAAGQVATLAQQVEQKEALAIQYTIELRRMLASVPIGEEVREFLFRIWSDVLAVAAVRHGAQDSETVRMKQAAADLIWAVSAKPERTERARVMQQLPGLLHVLRDGMAMLAIAPEEQERQVKLINDAVVQAFMARGEGLAPGKFDELAHALATLEDVVKDEPEGELWLDAGVIELMAGEDGTSVEVISEGGSQPAEAIVQWARQLELGTWFTLDYQGALIQVQYVWRSARGQLHLLAGAADKSYLVQTQRLAAYLQAGLLVPVEDEALTVRATREALAKLQAKPDELLH